MIDWRPWICYNCDCQTDNYSDQRSLIVTASALKQGLFYCLNIIPVQLIVSYQRHQTEWFYNIDVIWSSSLWPFVAETPSKWPKEQQSRPNQPHKPQNKQHPPQQPNQPQQPHSLSTYGHIDYKAETSMATQRIFLLRLIGKNYEEGQPNFN